MERGWRDGGKVGGMGECIHGGLEGQDGGIERGRGTEGGREGWKDSQREGGTEGRKKRWKERAWREGGRVGRTEEWTHGGADGGRDGGRGALPSPGWQVVHPSIRPSLCPSLCLSIHPPTHPSAQPCLQSWLRAVLSVANYIGLIQSGSNNLQPEVAPNYLILYIGLMSVNGKETLLGYLLYPRCYFARGPGAADR